MKIKRIYHPYHLWEEIKSNMWGKEGDPKELLPWAIEFTGDHKIYGSYMLKVIEGWKYSCEHNLTNFEHNQKAWIGHAACAYANECPEWIVRMAWGKLTDKQRRLANIEADNAIDAWQHIHSSAMPDQLELFAGVL